MYKSNSAKLSGAFNPRQLAANISRKEAKKPKTHSITIYLPGFVIQVGDLRI
jgi:hypothetical protein